jgi:pyruvate/2-oxoacid:ferredoxin oxidoreductase alpha subunit
VDSYLPAYVPFHQLDENNPVNINPVVMNEPLPDPDGVLSPNYMGFRLRLQQDLEGALPVIKEAGKEFGEMFGRSYADPLYRYRCEDADFLFITMGALASEASEVADMLRDEGIKAGVIGVRIFRPFPAVELVEAVRGRQCAAVLEKAISYGYEGPLMTELKAALYRENGTRPALSNFIVGLGGKDVAPADLVQAAHDSVSAAKGGKPQQKPVWIGFGV